MYFCLQSRCTTKPTVAMKAKIKRQNATRTLKKKYQLGGRSTSLLLALTVNNDASVCGINEEAAGQRPFGCMIEIIVCFAEFLASANT